MYVYPSFCICVGGCDDPLGKLRVGVEGSMGMYYQKHRTHTHQKEVTNPKGSSFWDGCDYMNCGIRIYFGLFLVRCSREDKVQNRERAARIGQG